MNQVNIVPLPYIIQKEATWNIDFNNLPVCLLQSWQLLFLDKRDGFANKDEKLYKPIIRKVLTAINGMSQQLFAGDINARYIYFELKKYVH